VNVREVDPRSERPVIEAIIQLRLRVWESQMAAALTRDDVTDRFDPAARHWAVFDGDAPVAAARLSVHDRIEDVPEAGCLAGVFASQPPAPIAFMSRLVVDAAYRGRGFGRLLDETRVRAADESGYGSLIALVFDVSGEARLRQLLARGFTDAGRGRPDTHPTFAHLPAPVVMLRLTQRGEG
jgi:GNAT superfamily N-acetyltransferase